MNDTERKIVSAYEKIARTNRSDWSEFLAEAEPDEIVYEMAETAHDEALPFTFDSLFAATDEWITAQRANPFCENRSTGGDACGECAGCIAEVARLKAEVEITNAGGFK